MARIRIQFHEAAGLGHRHRQQEKSGGGRRRAERAEAPEDHHRDEW
jgi:hypothetical protein